MRLEGFKGIYWWEWTHRLLARLVGAVFILPFLWFRWRGQLEPAFGRAAVALRPGGLLGAVGWWMVTSGLEGAQRSVSPYRLAFT